MSDTGKRAKRVSGRPAACTLQAGFACAERCPIVITARALRLPEQSIEPTASFGLIARDYQSVLRVLFVQRQQVQGFTKGKQGS